MALNIDGTTGISGVDGSASAPALQGTDSNTGINFGSDTVNINTGGTTRATVDSSGALNIGTTGYAGGGTSPTLYLRSTSGRQVKIHSTASGTCGIQFSNNVTGEGDDAGFQLAVLSNGDGFINNPQSNPIRFSTANAERMRITSGGLLLLNTPNSLDNEYRLHTFITSTGGHVFRPDGTSTRKPLAFQNNNGSEVGSVTSSTSSTSYNTSSDYRLKENVTAISDGITRLKTLKPSRFNFITDAKTTLDGFLAHEVTAVPEAITGIKDETQDILYTEEDTIPSGKKVGDVKETVPKYQGIDQSKLVPLLTAALQEAVAKIEVLETKVAALEAG